MFGTHWAQRPALMQRHTVMTIGVVGSAIVTLMTFLVSPVGTAASLWNIPGFRELRSNQAVVFTASVVLLGGVLALLIAWLLLWRLLPAEGERATATVVRCAIVWAAPMMVGLPLTSRDIFAYLGQGSMLAQGMDPYTQGVEEIVGWASLGVDPLWSTTATPYGPVWLLVERFAAGAILPMSYLLALLFLRIVAVGGLVVGIYYAWRLLVASGRPTARVMWCIAACPLILMDFVLAGHNDALMLGLIVAAVFYAHQRRIVLAVGLVTLAMGVKIVALIALPVVGLIYVGVQAPFWRRMSVWMPSGLASVAVLALLGIPLGVGPQWMWQSVATPATVSIWYAPVSIVNNLIAGVGAIGGLDVGGLTDVITRYAMFSGVAIGSYVLLTRRPWAGTTRLALAFAAVVFLSPVIHSWYVMWVLIFAAIAGLLNSDKVAAFAAVIVVGLTFNSLAATFNSFEFVTATDKAIFTYLAFAVASATGYLAWGVMNGKHAIVPAKELQPA